MLSIQKSTSNRTGLGYGLYCSNTASTSTTVFVLPANNVKNNEIKIELASENIDKGKNPRAKKANSQKPKQKKQYLRHHCGAADLT